MTDNNDRSIAELLASLCDETISAEEMERLDRLICSDAAVRRLYMEYLDLHAQLSYQFHQPAESSFPVPSEQGEDELSGPAFPIGGSSASVPFPPIVVHDGSAFATSVASLSSPLGSFALSYSLAAVIVGVGLLVGWACQMPTSQPLVRSHPRPAAAPLHPGPEVMSVGHISGMVECRWIDRKSETFEYAPVPVGRKYALASGLMEITYDSGARVILQGPCIYEVRSGTGGYLAIGRLTARVEKRGEGRGERGEARRLVPTPQQSRKDGLSPLSSLPSPLFAVSTPTAVVTDFGTEFGVRVDENGMTESHVFQGKVLLTALEGNGKQTGKITLAANESARVEKKGGDKSPMVRRRKVDPTGFVRSEQFAMRARQIGELPLRSFRRWQAESEKLRKRQDLLAYYDFQRDPDHPRDESGYEVLRNRSSYGSKFDGRVRGAIRMGMAQGRFPGKGALRFTHSSDGVRVNIPGEFPQLTLMASIALERCDGLSGILMTDKWESNCLHWQFTGGGGIKFSCFNPPYDYPLAAQEAADFAGWHVWSAVYDASAGRLVAYVDGQRRQEWPVKKGLILRIGEATIGNWDPMEGSELRPLCGRMDELAIFARALDDAEIKQLYDAGQWNAARVKGNGHRTPNSRVEERRP
jgi:hypothetical protein